MAVIKSDSARRVDTGSLRAFHLDDVMREARQAMVAAHARADEILRQAEAQAESMREAARAAGYEAGYQQGLSEGREAGRRETLEAARSEFEAQQASLVAALRQAVESIEGQRAAWQAAGRQDLIELAMAIARRVVRHVGQREREAVLANLEEAVQLAGSRSDMTIAVNPADAEAARLFAKSLVDSQDHWRHVRVAEEPEVSPGGCRVQWGTGAVDATLETQLARIEAALRGEDESGRGGERERGQQTAQEPSAKDQGSRTKDV